MYIYIGADYLVNEDDIVGIFDIETTTVSQTTRDYLTAAQKNGRIRDVSAEIPKTYVICKENGGFTVYLSQYSTATINRRRIFGSRINKQDG
ncbi:MAG: DUF370 domain-containing protein [Clostridia bacterium]|nr:DUF370 domain-containing protein [Clostridia bacterium]